tara:strand:- start:173 stop:1117 length:945 start_codon:yes stop_codon:yes gene_type:complete
MHSLRGKLNALAIFILPVFALAAAAEDPHPLHGTWISKQEPDSEDGEWELVFHPDGTFRMVTIMSDGLGDEDFGEDEFEDEESWEDILTVFDSNDNGVFDEEDYAAAQERGDEDLAESWDEVLEGDINDDGVIDEEEYNAWDDAEEDWEEFDPFADLSMAIFDDEEEIEMVMVMTGSWDSGGDQFTLEIEETAITINDMTLAEFYTELFSAIIDVLFEESGLDEDEFMAMIAEDDDTITAETLDELKAAMVDELLSEMDEVESFETVTETFDYSIDGDEMVATDSYGEVLTFVRLEAQSAVEAISWGQIKAKLR